MKTTVPLTKTSEFNTITLALAKTTIAPSDEDPGKSAVAYKIFGKNKAKTKETQEDPDTITIDGFEFELPHHSPHPQKVSRIPKGTHQ